MKIEEATINLLVMSTELNRQTVRGDMKKIQARTVGRIVGYSLNCMNEVIVQVECLDYDYDYSSTSNNKERPFDDRTVRKIKLSHPSNLEKFDSEVYYKDFKE